MKRNKSVSRPGDKKRRRRVNVDRSTWAAQIRGAIKAGHRPEKCVWPNYISMEADKEWIY